MKNHDLIDRYFENSLSPKEQKLFNDLLQNNLEFSNEFLFQKDLKKVIKDKPETSFSQHIIQGWANGVVRSEKKGGITNRYITHGK